MLEVGSSICLGASEPTQSCKVEPRKPPAMSPSTLHRPLGAVEGSLRSSLGPVGILRVYSSYSLGSHTGARESVHVCRVWYKVEL